MTFQKGDYIMATDENKVYQLEGIGTLTLGNCYFGQGITDGMSRAFLLTADHYRKATEEEVAKELEKAPNHYEFWISDKKDVIVSNGKIVARTIESAKEIFEEYVQRADKDFGVGDSFLSKTPTSYIQEG